MKILLTSFRGAALAAMLALAACNPPSKSELIIEEPWSNATPPGVTVGAAYMKFRSPVHDRLVHLSSPVAEKVEVHSMTHEHGAMHMRPLAELELPAGETVELVPSGLHVMLIGLKQPLVDGSEFPLQLHFEHAGERNVTVKVRAPGE
jgi:copper(I)-binding protein